MTKLLRSKPAIARTLRQSAEGPKICEPKLKRSELGGGKSPWNGYLSTLGMITAVKETKRVKECQRQGMQTIIIYTFTTTVALQRQDLTRRWERENHRGTWWNSSSIQRPCLTVSVALLRPVAHLFVRKQGNKNCSSELLADISQTAEPCAM